MTKQSSDTTQQDKLFADLRENLNDFAFDKDVVEVFPDMIARSVPGYKTTISTIGLLAGRYVTPGSNVYDLGSSLGEATRAIAKGTQAACQITGIDNSEAMVEKCRNILAADEDKRINIVCGDIREQPMSNASMCVLNFTLQFIPKADRGELIQRIYDALNPGGILVLSEKVRFPDQHYNELQIDLHHGFKRANGYSDLEIAQKRASLEKVLLPETPDMHRARMQDAGFRYCDVWYQCFNFLSMLAIK